MRLMPNEILSFVSADESATGRLAEQVGRYCSTGDMVRLVGDMGMGKSVFARGVLRGLGSTQEFMPSPTFTLMQTYDDTRVPTIHVDCYRINDPSEMAAVDVTPWLEHGVVIVEWPEQGGDWFPFDKPDMFEHSIMEVDNPGVLTVEFAETETGQRRLTFYANASWLRRMALIEPSLMREHTLQGRQMFLAECGLRAHVPTPVGGDASFRSFWRLYTPEGARVVMDVPPPVEDLKAWVDVAGQLKTLGVRVPEVYAADVKKGYALIEDFGTESLVSKLQSQQDVLPWYQCAVDVLIHLAHAGHHPLPSYTRADMWSEAARFLDWYLPQATGCAVHTADRKLWQSAWQPLFDVIERMPLTTMLWDYNASNIMLLGDEPNEPLKDVGLIDFQDARTGPCCYDLAMLLDDARCSVPEDMKKILIRRFVDGMDDSVDLEAFHEGYRAASMLRLFKIIGGFSRLALRDGKTHYLDNLSRCWQMVDGYLEYPEFSEVKQFLTRNLPAERNLKSKAV